MPPKSKKEVQPVLQEDFTQDVLLVTAVPAVQLKLGLLAAAERLTPEPLADAAAAPPLHVELVHSSNTAPVVSAPVALSSDFILPVNLEHKFRHKKGPDIIDRLINASLEVRLCNSQTKSVLASAAVDLLPFGLGSNEIQDHALPLQPAGTDDMFKVLPGSTLQLSIKLMHQPTPSPPVSAVAHTSTPSSSSSGSAAAAAAKAAAAAAAEAAAAAAAAGPVFEPFIPISSEEAAGCNVLEFVPLPASPVPPQLLAAAHNANGALSCVLALHLPTSSGKAPQAVVCSGASVGEEQVAWNKRCRAHLAPVTVQALKGMLELDQPLLLEVARQLTGTPADAISDPAFGNYHALLQLDCAAEQLQEPGAVATSGCAVPVGCMSWAVQQGKAAGACLPPYTPPAGTRAKPIEDAPAAPPDGQAPLCPWQAAGTRFAVQLRLARPLYAPWQPPPRPGKQLLEVIPVRQPPTPAPAPSAADRFRAKVQHVAQELAQEYAAANSSSSSSVLAPEQQQALVFELNRSGWYLAMKDQLKQLLVEVVRERYKTTGMPSPAQLQQLHSDLYVHLVDELRKAMADAAAQQQQQQKRQQQHEEQLIQLGQTGSSAAASADQLLQLAAECEAAGDIQRAHALYQRKLLLLESADAWYKYGAYCMRVKAHTRAQAAFREALSLSQQHGPAGLMCLGLALAQGKDAAGGPEPSALEWAEVLGHSLKDAAAGAGAAVVVPWALLALLYRIQGKPKEAQARSCHQEVVRQSKAALATSSGSSSSCAAGSTSRSVSSNGSLDGSAPADAKTPPLAGDLAVAANGYLAAAELAVQLKLPALAGQLLELAAGLKDPAGQLTRRLKLAAVAVAQQSGDSSKALALLKELADQVAATGGEEEKMLVQVLLGDVQFEAGNLPLAKQHYRRATQKAPQLCTPRVYLRLGACFMASGDVAIAADVYAACLECDAGAGSVSTAGSALASFTGGTAAGGPAAAVEVGPRCASAWLGLGQAYLRLGDYRSSELALSEASLCDPEHPAVWGYLALLSLHQGRERDADQSLKQAQRHGLSSPDLLVDLGDKYQELGRFNTAAGLLAKAAAVCDTVKVRCKLAAVLLAQHDYDGCQQQIASAACLPAEEADKELLMSVLQNLQVAWPHL